MKKLAALLLMLLHSSLALADVGPVVDPLKIQYMYSQDSIYIRFSDGSMPGCQGDNSGRLYDTNTLFEPLYSQVLTILAMGGIKAQVLYTIVNPGGGQWSDCEIDGLVLLPS